MKKNEVTTASTTTTSSFNADPNFDHKLDLVTAGARPFLKDHQLNRISRDNCNTIMDYVLVFQTEVNAAERYRNDTIYKLKQLSEFHNPKRFKDMTRETTLLHS